MEAVDLQKMIDLIQTADDWEISQIIQTVIRRYRAVFPEWEVVFLSLPLGEGREEAVRNAMEHLQYPTDHGDGEQSLS